MDIKEEIELLKTRINVELNSMMYHKDFSKIVEYLREKVDHPKRSFCDKTDVNHLEGINLLSYKAYLEVLLEYEIKEINRIIAEGKDNIFDNRSIELIEKVLKLEKEIDEVLSYLEDNFSFMKEEASNKYKELREKYYSLLDDSYKFNKTSLYQYLGIKQDITLSLYGSSASLFEQYLLDLEIYKSTYIDGLKEFIEKDKKIKESIAKAKASFSDTVALEAINQLEQNYIENLKKCLANFDSIRNYEVSALQEEMVNRSSNIDDLITKKRLCEEYSEYLNSITFQDYDLNKILEIEKFVNKYDTLEDDFYTVVYFIVEKDKRAKEMFGVEASLYDKLSPESKVKLERLFVERLSLLDDNQLKEALQEYKSKGFIAVKDKGLDSFFENAKIKNKALIIENIPKVKKRTRVIWLEEDDIKLIEKKILEKNPKHRRLLEKVFNKRSPSQIGAHTFCSRVDEFKPYKYFYFDSEGNKLALPDYLYMDYHVFNFFIKKQDEVVNLYNDKFNVIYKSDVKCGKIRWNMYTDYLVLVEIYGSEERVKVFDEDGHLLVKGDIADVMKLSGKKSTLRYSCFEPGKCQDGLIIAKIQNEENDQAFFYIYNLYTKKIIDTRKDDKDLDFNWGNERLPFKSKENNLYGFKDYDGNVVIEPKYTSTSGFSGNLAYVTENGLNGQKYEYLIDLYGNKVDFKLPSGNTGIGCDNANDRLYITENDEEILSFRADNDYRIEIDEPILEYLKKSKTVKR